MYTIEYCILIFKINIFRALILLSRKNYLTRDYYNKKKENKKLISEMYTNKHEVTFNKTYYRIVGNNNNNKKWGKKQKGSEEEEEVEEKIQ